MRCIFIREVPLYADHNHTLKASISHLVMMNLLGGLEYENSPTSRTTLRTKIGTHYCSRKRTSAALRGTSPMGKSPPPQDPPRTLGIGIR